MTDTQLLALVAVVAIVCVTSLATFVVWYIYSANRRLTNAVLARDNQEYKDLNAHDIRLDQQKKQPIKKVRGDVIVPLDQMSDEDIAELSKV